jgi:hypothetical protein
MHSAAALSSAAVDLVRRRHDTFAGALRVTARLTMAPRTAWPAVELVRRLGELATPLRAWPARRAADALAELGPSTKRLVSTHSW